MARRLSYNESHFRFLLALTLEIFDRLVKWVKLSMGGPSSDYEDCISVVNPQRRLFS